MRHPIVPYRSDLKARARELRKKMTLAEVLLWKRLKGKQLCGYDFDRQRPIGRRIVDFHCKELMLAVGVDGSVHDFTREKDERRQHEIESLGVTLLRFWNHEVKNDIGSVVWRIEEQIRAEEQRRGWPRREAKLKFTPNPSSGAERRSETSRDSNGPLTTERTPRSSPPGRGQGWVQQGAIQSAERSLAKGDETRSGNDYDAIIIGGGPAGSAASTILAEYGHRVLVLEREKFPRYHIGESLIPFTYQPLRRLGLIPKMKSSAFVKKYSVVFISMNGQASQPFYFFARYDRDTVAQTWQVLRSEFDQMLLDHARERGAMVKEETTVKELIWEDDGSAGTDGGQRTAAVSAAARPIDNAAFEAAAAVDSRGPRRVVGVRAQHKDGTVVEYRAPITLDCTGKESFAAVRSGWRMKDPYLNKIAVWTYYKGSKREPGIDEGQTTVAFVPDKGWFWHIPQHNDMVSVGVVAEGKYLSRGGVKSPEAIFKREINENLWIKDHLSVGEQVGPYYITSEYSFHSRHCGCDGLLLVGDAFAFLDPVFSSGLMLALKSGCLAADAVHEALVARDFSPNRFAGYAQALRRGIENMRKLVYAFYNPTFSFKQVIDKYPEAAGEITDCLSGDVDKDFSRLWKRIAEFAPLPDDLPVGEPLPSSIPKTSLGSA